MSGVRRPRMRQTVLRLSMRVWDAPTRLFHWAVVLLIALSYFSIHYDHIALHLHLRIHPARLDVVSHRLGVRRQRDVPVQPVPPQPVRGISASRRISAAGRMTTRSAIMPQAAGWSSSCSLPLRCSWAPGLLSNDDGGTEGALAHFISKDASDKITDYHALNFNIILGLICLHVVAIIAYAVVKRHNLVRPMITGRKRLPGATRQPRMASSLLAFLILVLSGVLVWILATRV